jgi:hypothetical protein
MARPKRPTFEYLLHCLFAIILLLLICCAIPILIPYSLIHRCFRPGPHRGLRPSDYPAIELYLDHFSGLHPVLIQRLSTVQIVWTTSDFATLGLGLKFWPTHRHSNDQYQFNTVTKLFVYLTTAGFNVKTLYDILQNEVETKIQISSEDKERFQKIRNEICAPDSIDWMKHLFKMNSTRGYKPAEKVPSGVKVIEMRKDSLDWLLDDSKPLIVPMDICSTNIMKTLTSLCPIWQRVDTDEELVSKSGMQYYWQLVDFRRAES